MIIRVVEDNVNVGLNCTENVYNVRLTNLGNAGLSAYQVAVANGFIGTEQDWLDSLGGSFTPSDYDLNEFTNESADPFVRESELPPAETTASIQTKRPLKTVNGNSLEGTGNVEIASSPLISVTEGGNTGIRRAGFNPANYGNIGQDAVDLSVQSNASLISGATGVSSFATGLNTIARGSSSFAEGNGSIASGNFSHAEGLNTLASGERSHAEGSSTTASGNQCHAEGTSTIASGNTSHAEGDACISAGYASHVEGNNNFARSNGEHSGGRFGTDYIPLNNGTDRIVNYGNGTDSSSRSDAFTIFRNGAVRFFRATLASITNAASGFLIFDSGNGNRPTVHNGTEWKALAYVGEGIVSATNLSNTPSPTGIELESSTGTGTTLPLATTTNAGLMSPSEKVAIAHSNRSVLDAITESFTTALKTSYDNAATWVTNASANIRATALTGLSTASATAITASDTVLSAFGKLQAQINTTPLTIADGVPSTTVTATVPTLVKEEAIGKLSGKKLMRIVKLFHKVGTTAETINAEIRLFDTVTLTETTIATVGSNGTSGHTAISRHIAIDTAGGFLRVLDIGSGGNPNDITIATQNVLNITIPNINNDLTIRTYLRNGFTGSGMRQYSSLIQVF